MTAQDRYRKAIGIVRAIEQHMLAMTSQQSMDTDALLEFGDQIVALTGRQRSEPKAKRQPRAQGKPNGAEAVTS